MEGDRPSKSSGLTRRGLLGGAASLGVGAGFGYAVRGLVDDSDGPATGGGQPAAQVDFYGPHQAGIATPAPEFLSFAAFDLTADSAEELRGVLQDWTTAAATLTAGQLYRPDPEGPQVAPSDPGEALDLGPSGLTVTFGVGPSLFERDGSDRLGLSARKPDLLAELPPFPGDAVEPARSGGDLCVQACADSPQVAFHAIHILTLIAHGRAVLRWSQDGFGRTSSTSRSQPTPRNLMGFKDGTNNIRGEEDDAMDRFVWVQPSDGPGWMAGGTYLIARRIKMLFDVWDATSLEGQERAVGREKASGAPLGQDDEYAPVDLEAKSNGEPVVPTDAHIRLASPHDNGGQRLLRRGYSFSEPTEPGSGEIDAGLFFISFQRDPQRQFVPVQQRLSESDALSRHLLHTSSAVFACPGGVKRGGFVGEGLFA